MIGISSTNESRGQTIYSRLGAQAGKLYRLRKVNDGCAGVIRVNAHEFRYA
jgi:hypothetical protein